MYAAKAIVAIFGAGVTAALGIFPEGTTTWNALTIASAVLTACAVYLVPNSDS
jgi:NAD-dependent SIR2 family protein deacetylase